MYVILRNKAINETREAKIGFSWTVFSLAFGQTLFRRDWLWFSIMLIIELILLFLTREFGIGLFELIMSFSCNRIYIYELLAKGFQPDDSHFKHLLDVKGFKKQKGVYY